MDPFSDVYSLVGKELLNEWIFTRFYSFLLDWQVVLLMDAPWGGQTVYIKEQEFSLCFNILSCIHVKYAAAAKILKNISKERTSWQMQHKLRFWFK